jgi:hypothetical protein
MARNNAATTRGKPFAPGNPGRPKGARHKATLAAEVLLDGEAETLTRKAIELAKGGDLQALRLCLERIAPPRKERPLNFALPTLEGPSAATVALRSIIEAVARGDLLLSEAGAVAGVVEQWRRMFEVSEFERRLAALEDVHGDSKS